MSIADFLHRTCQQTAVYWGNPTEDGEGGKTYDDPVEIKCRWESSTNLITSRDGREIICSAEVYVQEDLDEQGVLLLGTLDDLESDEKPEQMDEARTIEKFEKIPALNSTTEFLRKAYL